ncbi:LCP family protein [Kitasatospora sp. McL0602]|uniref:LCP family protein n=1 Tax=Kitasatospora sp. McL0602 TaxID=3439530 RepID=UPI003F8C8E68
MTGDPVDDFVDQGRGAGRAAVRQAAKASGRRRRRRTGVRRWARPVALTTGLVVLAGCSGAYLYIRHLDSNIKHAPLGAGNAPPPAGGADASGRVAMNILIIGTDSRKGLDGGYGDRDNVGEGNNDVNIVLHVYPDRHTAVALDLPRDTLIDLPQCKDPVTGKVYQARSHRPLNEAMGRGGPGCVQDTVQAVTKLRIDHFAVVNFQGVKDLTDAVGGVPVNLCTAVKDKDSHLDLPAGPHTLNGEEGLAFVRTRHAVQDGSAVGRFSMQRAFLSALVRKLTAQGTLLDPTKAFPVIEAATKSITVDDPISGTTGLVGLATELKNIKPAEIAFVQPPTEYTQDEPTKELQSKDRFVQPGADDLFALILADKSLTGGADQGTPAPTAPATPPAPAVPAAPATPPAPAVDPASVVVTVLNGTKQPKLATTTAETLQGLKYLASPGSGAPTNVAVSTVKYGQADRKSAAEAVARALGLPDSAVTAAAAGSGRALVVTLGADFHPATTGSPAVPAPASVPTAVPTNVAVHTGDDSKCIETSTGGVLKP